MPGREQKETMVERIARIEGEEEVEWRNRIKRRQKRQEKKEEDIRAGRLREAEERNNLPYLTGIRERGKRWKRGDPHLTNSNPNMLEGIASIGEFIGRSYDCTRKWILMHGLPATKTPSGRWFSHKGLIFQWMLAGHSAELKARVQYSLEESEIALLAEEFGVDPVEVFNLRDDLKKGKVDARTGKKTPT